MKYKTEMKDLKGVNVKKQENYACSINGSITREQKHQGEKMYRSISQSLSSKLNNNLHVC